MSDDLVGRYRRVYVRIWDDPKFRELSSNEQIITLYLLSGPQTNRIGLFKFSIPQASEDLNLGIETFKKAFANVCTTFGWLFDAKARVLYVPTWWRWNLSVNTNIFLGNLKDLSEIPSCAFVDAFAANTAYIPPKLLETFIEALRIRLPKASRTSEAVAGTGSETGAGSEDALTRVLAEKGSGSAKNEPKLTAVARQAIQLTSPNKPIEELLDAFGTVAQHEGLRAFTRADAAEALNRVLLERRAS